MEFQVRWNRCKVCIRHEIDFFAFICLRLVLLASNIKVYRIPMRVISSHSLKSRQILIWPPFNEIENNNCFKIYPARSDLKKIRKKTIKTRLF